MIECKVIKMSLKVKIIWLFRCDFDIGIENMFCFGVIIVLGRGVVGFLMIVLVLNILVYLISVSKNFRNVICVIKKIIF